MKIKYLLTLSIAISCFSCNQKSKNEGQEKVEEIVIPQIKFQVIDTLVHDSTAFVEGLEFANGDLYESTGSPEQMSETKSLIGIRGKNGKIIEKSVLEKKYFGEGITILNNKVFQLTYKHQTGFVYDSKTFKKLKTFDFDNAEGWGMTNDGKQLIMSDGTYKLTFIDPNTLQKTKELSVTENGYGKQNLNELEFVDNFIYANIYQTNQIVKINPSLGNIVGVLDFTPMAEYVKRISPKSLEMNGIAYDSKNKVFYLTGKMWSKIFVIRLI